MTKIIFPGILFFLLSLSPLFPGGGGQKTIKIGFNIPLTGDSPKFGESVRLASELVRKSVNDAGGLEIKGKKYILDFIYADNELKTESAVRIAYRFIEGDQVLAMVGPVGSGRAIPAGEIHNENRTPMITPTASNPAVTMNRPYVFRACILDPVQAQAAVKFAGNYFSGISKAAVLYNHEEEYSRQLAEFFRKNWEESHGPASVLSYESFGQKDMDFSAQLQRIAGSGAELLYLPVYYNHAALIVTQAGKLGWGQRPILGSDSWSSSDLLPLSQGSVIGCYFTTNFAAAGGLDNTLAFIDAYKAAYGHTPDEVSALSYDSVQLILQAIQRAGITGKIVKDREALKNALAGTRDFEGVTGRMNFDMTNGNPRKYIVIVRVSPSGEFEYVTSL